MGAKEYQDGLALHRAAHAFNGRSRNREAGGVAALCGDLEEFGKTGQLKDVDLVYEQMFHSKALRILRRVNMLNAMTIWTSGTD